MPRGASCWYELVCECSPPHSRQMRTHQVGPPFAHCRTYRLSGRRWIYNKVELVLRQADGGTASAAVAQAVASNQPLGAAQARPPSSLLQLPCFRGASVWVTDVHPPGAASSGSCTAAIPGPAQCADTFVSLAQAAASPTRLPVALPLLQESAVAFLLQLDNGAKVQAAVYLCHADPEPCSPSAATAAGGEEGGSGSGAEKVAW